MVVAKEVVLVVAYKEDTTEVLVGGMVEPKEEDR